MFTQMYKHGHGIFPHMLLHLVTWPLGVQQRYLSQVNLRVTEITKNDLCEAYLPVSRQQAKGNIYIYIHVDNTYNIYI